jgi:hypothetical protein
MYILGIRVPDLFIFLLDNNFSPKKLEFKSRPISETIKKLNAS